MKKAIFWTACALVSCVFALNMPFNTTASAQTSDFACQYAQTTSDTDPYVAYGGTARMLTAEQAAAENIPAGYSNEVIVVEHLANTYSCGVLLDFSSSAVQIAMVDSITFRVYVGSDGVTDGYPELRIVKPNTGENDWIMRYYLSNNQEEDKWVDVTLDAKGTNFASGNTLESLAKDGILDKFELSVRVKKAEVPFYIDSVSVKMKENDGVAPVITYDGPEEISVFAGAQFSLNATAFDAQENKEKELEYIWTNKNGATVTVEAGKAPAMGNYTLTLRASDYYGNVAEKSIRVIVKEADTTPPEIKLNAHTVYALTGTIPYLNIEITDDSGEVNSSIVWSQGALDKAGKLTEGTHTLTVVAKDSSDNKAEKVVTVYVLPNEVEDDVVIDEEELTPDEPQIPDTPEIPDDDDSEDSSIEDSTSDEPASSEEPDEPTDSTSDEPASSEEPDEPADSASDEPASSEEPDEPISSEEDDQDSSGRVENSVSEEEKPASKGCGGVVGGLGVMVALGGAAIVFRKKKE